MSVYEFLLDHISMMRERGANLAHSDFDVPLVDGRVAKIRFTVQLLGVEDKPVAH